jgi:hypothetical protein
MVDKLSKNHPKYIDKLLQIFLTLIGICDRLFILYN